MDTTGPTPVSFEAIIKCDCVPQNAHKVSKYNF